MLKHAARKGWSRGILAGIGSITVALSAVAEEPIVIKFSHVVAADTPKGLAAEHFKKLAEERTRGRVRVEVYPDSQMFRDQVELAALELGTVQMLAPSLSKLSALGLPEFEVFDLPYVFQDYAQVHRVTEGPLGQAMLKKLETKGIVGLTFWDSGFKHLSANRPLRLPSDAAGLKMRIQPSRALNLQMRAMGAVPVAMAFSDVEQALRSRVIDGTENSVSNFYTQGMHKNQKYLTLTGHGYLGYVVLVNQKFWDGLPGDIRQTLSTAVKDATRFANDIAQKKNEEALEAVKKTGQTQVVVLTPEEKLRWTRMLFTTHREQASFVGKDLLQSVYRETGGTPAQSADRKALPDAMDPGRAATSVFREWSRSLLAVF